MSIRGTLSGTMRKEKVLLSTVPYTDTLKDGTLKGPNLAGIKKLLKTTTLRVIASGGVSRLGDLQRLKVLQKDGLSGVIVGKALYEGRFTLRQALHLAG